MALRDWNKVNVENVLETVLMIAIENGWDTARREDKIARGDISVEAREKARVWAVRSIDDAIESACSNYRVDTDHRVFKSKKLTVAALTAEINVRI
jgi:hypothetical protein